MGLGRGLHRRQHQPLVRCQIHSSCRLLSSLYLPSDLSIDVILTLKPSVAVEHTSASLRHPHRYQLEGATNLRETLHFASLATTFILFTLVMAAGCVES